MAVKPAPAAVLKSIAVAPDTVKLVGRRAEQGLVVTGKYSDGTERDLTQKAKFQVSSPAVVAVTPDESRRVVRPRGDGSADVTVTVTGAPPAVARVQVAQMDATIPVSFRDEVVPALTKAGCSMGTCHGTPTGKGGLRLSLQGYAPELDYAAIVGEGGGRRVNRADPGRSLLLLKPLLEVAHAGGKRLTPEMPEFEVLYRWIAEGLRDDPEDKPKLVRVDVLPGRRTLKLPGARQQIAAQAYFSDGSVRDVTRVAKLTTSDEDAATVTREGLVEGQKRGDVAVLVRYQDVLQSQRITFLKDVPGFKWSNPPVENFIDREVFQRLKLFQIPVSDLAPD
ncbi:MAG TPA: hypothetical protein VK689_12535, partial [Armatimonadota bacterium]|nr:hypothetical protein [Armatimonadota bacterium]